MNVGVYFHFIYLNCASLIFLPASPRATLENDPDPQNTCLEYVHSFRLSYSIYMAILHFFNAVLGN